MNWLAHIYLSEKNINFQIGNYIADPLKGRVWENADNGIVQGMKIHKIIDTFTDQHPIFIQSKMRLGEKGLLKAVVVDLTYDYLLTKNWNTFCTIPIDIFLNTFYQEANSILPTLPVHASKPLKRMVDFDLLNKYQNLEHLNLAFQRVDKRLSSRLLKRDQVTRYYEKVCDNIDKLESDFLDFFPILCQKVKENVDSSELTHWKREV